MLVGPHESRCCDLPARYHAVGTVCVRVSLCECMCGCVCEFMYECVCVSARVCSPLAASVVPQLVLCATSAFSIQIQKYLLSANQRRGPEVCVSVLE